jgi:endoglucanase
MARLFFPNSPISRSRHALLLSILTVGVLASPVVRAQGVEMPVTSIKVDQVGYPLHGPKIALVSVPAKTFEIKRFGDGRVVFQGKMGPAQFDPDSGDTVEAADFSELHQVGEYYIEVPGVGRSWDFHVGDDVFEHTYYLAMRAFYGQRCGTAVDLGKEFPGYSHAACHVHGEFHPSSGATGERDNIGGWHDAGDYGRYMVNSGVTTGTLLWTWELFGAKIQHIKLDIPETGNGTPDILNEARWNLQWMLKMQDSDGGAWQKQASEYFPGFVAPDADTLPSEVIGTGSAPYKSTCATADLAAVGAIAARVYRPFDAQFSARALDAARRAWEWTEKYPNVTFKNPPGVTTGEYGDANCADERLWAAAELWRTTGESKYHQFFLSQYAAYLSHLDTPPESNWSDMSPMALESYALSQRKDVDRKAQAAIRERILAAARTFVAATRADPYRMSMKAGDFRWGSNGFAAGYGVELLIANQIAPNPDFVDAARDNLHYLLGRNTFSLSWVTQVGENAVLHPHHRPSASTKLPWPGLVVGGPNVGRQDAVLSALPKDLQPAKVYADEQASYASNEIAINWQAPLVFLLAGELP